MRFEQSVEFRCTARELWPFLTESERLSDWMYKGQYRLVPEEVSAPLRVGSRGRLMSARGEDIGAFVVTGFEPFRHLEARLTVTMLKHRRFESRASFTLHEELGTTRVDYVNESDLGFFGNLLNRLVGGFLTRRGWQRLRRALEQPG